jgi:hypothetical protein
MSVACLLLGLLTLSASSADGYTFPPRIQGPVSATLNVTVDESTAGPPRVRYILTVDGPPDLQVEPPVLSDPTAGWKAHRSSAWSRIGDTVHWSEVVDLEQVKPGLAPLPDVALRFRVGKNAPYHQEEWTDVLKNTIDVPLPPIVDHPSDDSSMRPVLLASLIVAGAAAVVILIYRRRRAALDPPPTLVGRALGELDRLETAPPESLTSQIYYTQLSNILRRYLAERFRLPALQQTTTEFLQTLAQTDRLTLPQQSALQTILERCDLSKFAQLDVDPSQRRTTTDLARNLIRQTSQQP